MRWGRSAALALLLPWLGTATAQPVSGLYVGAGAGGNFHQNTTSVARVHTDIGPVGLLSLGWGFGNGLRLEIEGSYRENPIDQLLLRTVAGPYSAGRSSSGRLATYGAMANLFYDGSLAVFGQTLLPYAGVGIGYAYHDYRKVTANGTFFGFGPGRHIYDDGDGRFAYQAIGGIAVPIPAVPGLAATGEYRFLGMAGDARIDGKDETINRVLLSSGTSRYTNYNHSLLFGLRYAFNAPAAPVAAAEAPPPPASPAVSRVYLIFFDWDKTELTDRARQIISQAASNARTLSATRIEIAGHADRSGTPQYNQRLSERRAQAVATELVRQGVARTEIAITAFGESRPLVPTADGVREIQNRRVEIVLRY